MIVEITVYEMYNYIKQTFISLKHRNNLTVTVTLKSDKVSVHTFKNNNQKSQRAITIARQTTRNNNENKFTFCQNKTSKIAQNPYSQRSHCVFPSAKNNKIATAV